MVSLDAGRQGLSTLMARIRIPAPKVKWEPIELLYEETQEVILPELMNVGPAPPFNSMFGGYCRKDVVFLCGGLSYEGTQVSSRTYLYSLDPGGNSSKPRTTIGRSFVRFEEVAPMNTARYSHAGIYHN